MNTTPLEKFAKAARLQLLQEVNDRLTAVLLPDSLERKEYSSRVAKLETEAKKDRKALVARVAYTWFNRLCALGYMDACGYSADLFGAVEAKVLTPGAGRNTPQLLEYAKLGQVDESLKNLDRARLGKLLSGEIQSLDADTEVYRRLLISTCNLWHEAMPFLFKTIDDASEVLLPSDLLSQDSIIAKVVEVLTPERCEEGVEVIGWLYQFYISDKKDEVFDRPKTKKIEAEDIPAATQLFTPHWIVKYLVENSLGRLWMLNNPSSGLSGEMEYYIAPEEGESQGEVLKIASPSEIKICDPACGSGHMLTYAFELLLKIYEEKGVSGREAVTSILEKNLYGIEIDERAGALAAFALSMKARGEDRRYFRRDEVPQPQVCVLEDIKFSDEELEEYFLIFDNGPSGGYQGMSVPDRDYDNLLETLGQFEQATNFGSLIQPALKDGRALSQLIDKFGPRDDIFIMDTHRRVQLALKQAEYLSQRYQVVVANPPYMGGKGMNNTLKAFAKTQYKDSKSDLFAMFIERGFLLCIECGYSALVTMHAWMFLSSYEDLRKSIIHKKSIVSLVQIGVNSFPELNSKVVQAAATVYRNSKSHERGSYIRLMDHSDTADKPAAALEAIRDSSCGWFYRASAEDFRKIPGSPVAYWADKASLNAFLSPQIGALSAPRLGMATADNSQFMRMWWEVELRNINREITDQNKTKHVPHKWFPYAKGGGFQKWYGNDHYIVNWKNDGEEVRDFSDPSTGKVRSHNYNDGYIFKPGVTWNALTSTDTSARVMEFSLFDNAGSSLFACDEDIRLSILAVLNSRFMTKIFPLISPTLNYQPGDISKVPIPILSRSADLAKLVRSVVEITKASHRSVEISVLFDTAIKQYSSGSYAGYLADQIATQTSDYRDVSLIENSINELINKSIGILESDHDLKSTAQIDATEALSTLLTDQFSYFIGTTFGRYSLDTPGLILANAGDGLPEYRAKVPNPTYSPDADGIIPFVEAGAQGDYVVSRCREFIRVAFGEEHLSENMAYVEEVLGVGLEKWFTTKFYTDHIKRYKKRPIYWMFVSKPKGKAAFQALIYLHRYTPDTVGLILQDYLNPFISGLEDQIRRVEEEITSRGDKISAQQKTQATKTRDKLRTDLAECRLYREEVLRPLADRRIALDLDDGVLVNYNRMGAAVVEVTGLNDKKARAKVRGFEWCEVSEIPKYGQ